MNARLLLTAGALSLGLGLTSPALAQGMQPEPMQPGMQGQAEDGMAQQRPMKRSAKKMKKPMKARPMTRQRQPMQDDGMRQGGAPGAAPDDGM